MEVTANASIRTSVTPRSNKARRFSGRLCSLGVWRLAQTPLGLTFPISLEPARLKNVGTRIHLVACVRLAEGGSAVENCRRKI